ncbi:MAG: hypothetical protein HY343_01550 [Lentisphaerae bacterium]|nr:hypothetical protein [Lentisphaerota bacterium]
MKKTIIALLLALAMIAMVIAAIRVLRGRGEYALLVSPDGTVTVSRTDNNARGGPFTLSTIIAPGTYILGSEDDAKDIYTVTFYDTTRRPGRFTLFIGNSTLDIMEARIIFDQKEEMWHK